MAFSHSREYDAGELMSEYSEVDGKVHGLVHVYWKNGNLQRVGNYHEGQPHGEFTYHDEHGEVLATDSWTMGVNDHSEEGDDWKEVSDGD